ncbi:hypothetical protein F5Y18DRAFT_105105 [Xylariaceae sp. FL1019]|nr:hypothetical protein F5Y18DRAFT_105105 [Xylariaceae sp. FL1019]
MCRARNMENVFSVHLRIVERCLYRRWPAATNHPLRTMKEAAKLRYLWLVFPHSCRLFTFLHLIAHSCSSPRLRETIPRTEYIRPSRCLEKPLPKASVEPWTGIASPAVIFSTRFDTLAEQDAESGKLAHSGDCGVVVVWSFVIVVPIPVESGGAHPCTTRGLALPGCDTVIESGLSNRPVHQRQANETETPCSTRNTRRPTAWVGR